MVPSHRRLGSLLGFLRGLFWARCCLHCLLMTLDTHSVTVTILYADDLLIYYHFYPSDIEGAVLKINEDIRAIEKCVKLNKLSLNVGKSKAMVMGSARYLNGLGDLNDIVNLTINNQKIKFYISIKYLDWSEQIQSTSSKVNGVCGT